MKGTSFITELISNICTYGQQILTNVIYIIMFVIFVYVVYKCIRHLIKLSNVEFIIELLNNNEKTEEEVSTLEKISNNFPIMVQELKDVYDAKKPKQISAIDLFENNLIMPANEESLLRTCINSLTALGLLGTFIGLIASINQIGGIKETGDAISALLVSMGPAITTTILGVAFSLFCTGFLTLVKSGYQKKSFVLEQQLMKEKPSDTNPDYFYDSFTTFTGKKYTDAMEKIVDKFLDQMKSSLNKDLEAYKNVIHNAMESLKTGQEKFNEGANALKDTVDNINKYLHETESLNKNFEVKLKDFTIALDDFNNNFKESKEATFGVLKNVKEINEKNYSINGQLMESLQKELLEIAQGFELMKEMNLGFKQEIMNTPNQLNGSIEVLCQNITDVTNKIDNRASKVFEDITSILKQLSERIDTIEKLVVTSSSNDENELSNVESVDITESINNIIDNNEE